MFDRSCSLQMLRRRAFLGRSAQGVGTLALASLLTGGALDGTAEAGSKGVLKQLPLPQKAKRVIWLTMAGGPSQFELYDYKEKLAELDGEPMPESMTKGQQLAQLQGQKLFCLGPSFHFKSMVAKASRSVRCCRISVRSSMISVWCVR